MHMQWVIVYYKCTDTVLIFWLSNLLTLSVHDEGYSRSVPCALIWWRTRWRLFQKRTVCTYLIAYTMKVIPETYRVHLFDSVHDEGYSRSVPCALIWWRTRWRLFQKRTVCTYLIAYTMKVIPEAYRVYLFDGVHDEGYARSVPCALIW